MQIPAALQRISKNVKVDAGTLIEWNWGPVHVGPLHFVCCSL
jgi:hypothetical protein